MVRWAVPLILIFVTGCSGLASGGSWDPFAQSSERRLHVRVQNLTTTDVNVHILAPGRRLEVGLVASRSIRDFSIPWSGTQDARFQVEQIAGRRHTTTGVQVGPGERVEVIVQDPLQRTIVRR